MEEQANQGERLIDSDYDQEDSLTDQEEEEEQGEQQQQVEEIDAFLSAPLKEVAIPDPLPVLSQ